MINRLLVLAGVLLFLSSYPSRAQLTVNNPPPPIPGADCAGGAAVTGWPNYGALFAAHCGSPVASGTINLSTIGQIGGYTGTGTITGFTPGGDVTFASPNFAVTGINGVALGSTTATAGNVMVGSGSLWATHPISGDVTMTGTGVVTIANGVVTAAKLAAGAAVGNIANGSISNAMLTNSSVTINTRSLSLGGALTLAFTDFAGQIAGSQLPALSGDVTSSASSAATTVARIQGRPVTTVVPAAKNVLAWDGSQWTPTLPTGAGSGTYSCPTITVDSSSYISGIAVGTSCGGGGTPGLVLDTQSSDIPFALPVTDANKIVYRTNFNGQADTIDTPLTNGFGLGFGLTYFSVSQGNSLSPLAGAMINGRSSLAFGPNQGAQLFSDGAGYRANIYLPTPPSQDGTLALYNDFVWRVPVDTHATGIAAAGTTQANCTTLTKAQSYIATVAPNSGVCLPPAVAGAHVSVCDKTTTPLLIYAPADGVSVIAPNTATQAVQISQGCVQFIAESTTAWWFAGPGTPLVVQ